MCRWLPIAGLALLLGGCDTANGLGDAVAQSVSPTVPNDPARDAFGVSAPASDATAQQLDWKVGQLCTNGADEQKPVLLAAEDGSQIAAETVICRPYHLSVF